MATILLVEDNAVNADMLMRRLTRRGYQVELAMNGLDAVEKTALLQPSLVLMDMSLPEIDGWEATRRIKANPATAGIPVIALTAHAMASDRIRSFEAGCQEFETKPVNFARLIEKMQSFAPEASRT